MDDKLKSLRDSSEFAEERLVASVQSLLEEILHEKGLNKTDLANKMGVSKARVSQIFSDNQNFTLRLLANAFHALGEELRLTRAGQNIEYKSADVLPDMNISLEAKRREISHGFEWLDWPLEQGGQSIDVQPLSKACMAQILSDVLNTAMAQRGQGARSSKDKDAERAITSDWSRNQNGSNVIPMVRKKAVGNG